MKFLFTGLFLLISIFTADIAQAGVVVGGTRVIFNESQHEASLSVNNPDLKLPYLIQSWVDGNGPTGANAGAAKPPFIVTPPLFRLDSQSENVVRIVRTGGNLPDDKESVFWMNVKSIPATVEGGSKNVLQISIKTRIKMFYRPKNILGSLDSTNNSLVFSRTGNHLLVNNPGTYYISFYSLAIGNSKISTTDIMAAPKSTTEYVIPANTQGNKVSWKIINDFGGLSTEKMAAIK